MGEEETMGKGERNGKGTEMLGEIDRNDRELSDLAYCSARNFGYLKSGTGQPGQISYDNADGDIPAG